MNPLNSKQDKHFYEFGPYRLEVSDRLLLKDGEPVPLKKKAVETLLILIEHRGEVVRKDDLMQALWPDSFVEESNLSQYIYLLRKTLGGADYIATVPGRGYRFTAEAHEGYGPDEQIVMEDHSVARMVITGQNAYEVSGGSAAAELTRAGGQSARATPGSFTRHRRAILLAALALVTGAGIWWWWPFARTEEPEAPSRMYLASSFKGNENEPAFSPDGKQLAFVWDGENDDSPDVYVKLLDVGTPLRLTEGPEVERWPVWSPDGRFIAFTRDVGGGLRQVILMPALGGHERKLGLVEGGLDWSPDGGTLAVIDQRAVTLLAIETGQRRRLTDPPPNLLNDAHPAFSPDGQKVAFTRSDGGTETIYIVPAAGGETRRVTFDNSRIQSLCWMPDGQHLIYASTRAGISHLWKIHESGGDPVQVSATGGDLTDVTLSLDGTRLAFARTVFDTNIGRLELAGGAAAAARKSDNSWTQLISSTRSDDSPQYSPDGQHIVFASQRSGYDEIWVCASDGSNARQVTQMRAPSTGSPRWSPDGREIAFDCRLDGHGDIFVISAEGGQVRRLTTDPALDVVPSWSRDGQWIYFSSMRSGERQIWKVPAHGGEATQVTSYGGFDSYESADGQYLYYTKQRETPGVWRLPLQGGEEEPIPGLEGVKDFRAWALNDQGIYFAVATPATGLLKFYSFATGRVSDVATLPKKLTYGPPLLSVSADGRSILYAQRDSLNSDIMVVENFR